MRYYTIIISDPQSGKEFQRYSSFQNGQTLAGALDIEFDIPVVPFAAPMGVPYVRVWGIPLAQISQSNNLVGKRIQVFGGMQKGLPLANPNQNGLLVQGFIQQALGNWVGNDMTLDMFIATAATPANLALNDSADSALDDVVPNIVLNWKANTPLAQAIEDTLTTAYPGFSVDIAISDDLVRAEDQWGFYSSLTEFSQWVKMTSLDIVGDNYAGVDITVRDKVFVVRDGTTETPPKLIAFQDLVGQPTWIDSPFINIKLVMRADLQVWDFIKLPEKGVLAVTTPQAVSQFRNLPTFKGVFFISRVRHVGHYRQPTAESWVTVVDASSWPVA
jgi:hypothetical protein